jgi:hypothetical protein
MANGSKQAILKASGHYQKKISKMLFTRSAVRSRLAPPILAFLACYARRSSWSARRAALTSCASAARLKGRRGIVLRHQLDLGGLTLARDLADRDCADPRESVETQPMRRGTVAFEETCGAREKRIGANGGDVAGPRSLPLEEVNRCGI